MKFSESEPTDDEMNNSQSEGNVTAINMALENVLLESESESEAGINHHEMADSLKNGVPVVEDVYGVQKESNGGNLSIGSHGPVSSKVCDSLVGLISPLGPNGLPYKKCLAIIRNAHMMKKKFEGQENLSEKNKQILQKSIDTVNDTQLTEFVAEWNYATPGRTCLQGRQ